MSTSKIPAALAAADTFLTALCEGRVPPCFVPGNEHVALGANVGAMVLRALPVRGSALLWWPAQREKLAELRDLVRAACVEVDGETTGEGRGQLEAARAEAAEMRREAIRGWDTAHAFAIAWNSPASEAAAAAALLKLRRPSAGKEVPS